jgi:hypothetical protein
MINLSVRHAIGLVFATGDFHVFAIMQRASTVIKATTETEKLPVNLSAAPEQLLQRASLASARVCMLNAAGQTLQSETDR